MAAGNVRLIAAVASTLALGVPLAQAQFQTLPVPRPNVQPEVGSSLPPESPAPPALATQVLMSLHSQLAEGWFSLGDIVAREEEAVEIVEGEGDAAVQISSDGLAIELDAGQSAGPVSETIPEASPRAVEPSELSTESGSDEPAQVEQSVAATGLDSSAAIAACRAELDAILGEGTLLFPSGQTALAAQSAQLMPSIAETLAQCPEAMIYVEGHTDSQGDAGLNLTLSIARAESVVDGLIDLGIAPARLFAVGYGASLPIADNGTAEGRRTNRRIVFAFQDIAEPQD